MKNQAYLLIPLDTPPPRTRLGPWMWIQLMLIGPRLLKQKERDIRRKDSASSVENQDISPLTVPRKSPGDSGVGVISGVEAEEVIPLGGRSLPTGIARLTTKKAKKKSNIPLLMTLE